MKGDLYKVVCQSCGWSSRRNKSGIKRPCPRCFSSRILSSENPITKATKEGA